MNIGQLRPLDVANGPGIRVSLFVTGCSHHCPGCFNEEYQDPAAGTPFDEETFLALKTALENPLVRGLSLLGGEPMEQAEGLTSIISRLKETISKDIWIYSGYTWEEILKDPKKKALLVQCDVLVDGRFVEEKKNLRLKFRGSSNQRIIDIQKSLSGTLTEYPL